ncbi:flagellar export chaperone FliS [Desulfovibrio legallii]|jgi:flagellar protein FliS|uniref:Flagellar protein FliS n=1 Tax=Desulfovibrio legallii TaxID=571438 RepID=A0A1G7MF32_9BACT|nr:flagellar export chaperone FliS [Desulfovibrio legallii]SDF59790.1 flagellar protein FliS [Desulfovibrio legallii]
MNKAAHAYFQTNISTTDQGQLLLMLYDGALKYLHQARDKILAKDYAAKGVLISRVIDIVNELAASLNMEKGGSLAVNLNNLYLLCTARLLRANLKMDLESLDSVEHILAGLRDAYSQIIETPEARRAASEIANRMQLPGSTLRTAQPILPPTPAGVPRAQVSAAYGRTAAAVGEEGPARIQPFTPSPARPGRLPGAYGKPQGDA